MSAIDMAYVRNLIPKFREFIALGEGQQWHEERQEKDVFFAKYFQENTLDSFDEGTLRELIYILWSFNGWTNKDWVLQEMPSSGLPTIRKAFKQLLYGSMPLAERFDFVKDSIRMMGAASVSEILVHHDRKNYPIWNRRSRQGLMVVLGNLQEEIGRAKGSTPDKTALNTSLYHHDKS